MENLCRICLKVGANILIFDGNGEDSVCNKLSLCLRGKVEDLDGYPRKICIVCYSNLELICSFIKKYKESQKVLSTTLVISKLEPFDDSHAGNSHQIEIEIDEYKVKSEPEFIDSKHILDEPIKLEIDNSTDPSITQINTFEGNETSLDLATQVESNCRTNKRKRNRKNTKISLKEFKVRTRKLRSLKKKNALKQRRKIESKDEQKISTESDEPKPPKLCDICGGIFETSEALSKHKKKHENLSVECSICKRTYTNALNLHRHIIRKHKKKDFFCDACGASYAWKFELTKHYEAVHVKKQPLNTKIFSCKLCSMTYKCMKSVVIHERSVHTGERPAVCTVCNASFFHDEYLKEHMRLHTGEAPFKCPVCGRGYAQRNNMKSHLRIHKVSELDSKTLSELRPAYLKRLRPE